MRTPPEILLVDDDPDIRDSLTIILESAGFTVRCAANGQEALRALNDRRPDLLILDVMMTTDTEGFDLAFELRERSEFAALPIVLLTSFLEKVRKDGPGPFQHILGEGWPAAWLFEKPVEPKALVAKLRAVLEESAGPDPESQDD